MAGKPSTDVLVRPIEAADVTICGRICYEGYKGLADRHGFAPPFPSVDAATRRIRSMAGNPAVSGFAAEAGGAVAGFNFLTRMDPVWPVGPLVVDPAAQGKGIGRELMNAALDRADGTRSVRLLTAAYNFQSLPLYVSLGFEAKEPLLAVAGRPESAPPDADYEIRLMEESDLAGCEALHARVHGYSRANELRERCAEGGAIVALHRGAPAAYLAAPASRTDNHGVAVSEAAMIALLQGAGGIVDGPLALLLPVRQAELFRWCLAAGFRLANPMVLMARGDYADPRGVWIPSINY